MANEFQSIVLQTLGVAMSILRKKLPALSALATEPATAGRKVRLNETIRVRVPVVKAAQTFTGTFTRSDTNYEAFNVTVDQAKYVMADLALLDASEDADPASLIQKNAEVIAISLAQAIAETIAAKAEDASFTGTQTIAVGSGDFDEVIALGVKLDNNLIYGPRAIVADPTLYGEFLSDERVVDSAANSGTDAKRSGVLPEVNDFDIIKSNGAYTDTNMRGFACDNTGMIFAAVQPDNLLELAAAAGYPVPANATVASFVEPGTGLVLQGHYWYSPESPKLNMAVLAFYGIGVGRANALVRILKVDES